MSAKALISAASSLGWRLTRYTKLVLSAFLSCTSTSGSAAGVQVPYNVSRLSHSHNHALRYRCYIAHLYCGTKPPYYPVMPIPASFATKYHRNICAFSQPRLQALLSAAGSAE